MKRTCIKATSEKGKPIKANAESDFSNIPALFTSAQGSLKKSYKTRGSALFIPISSGSSGIIPTDGNYR